MTDEKTLKLWAKALGFCDAALCSAEEFTLTKAIAQGQPPIAERRQLKYAPHDDDPRIKSLAVLLWSYQPAALPKGREVFIDSYYEASHAAYHASRRLEAKLREAGCFAQANVAYPAREAAVRAGMGIIGQSSMLITPEHGTRVVIILMATDIETDRKDRKQENKSCLRCGRCAEFCPSGAIDQHGMMHPERCLRNHMMEGSVVPEAVRSKMGMVLIGCDICQRVCPMQPRYDSGKQNEASFTLDEFVTNDQQQFKETVLRLGQLIGKNAARPQRVRAQAALLAGNSKDPAYLPVLECWSEMPFEAVSEHAKWSITEIRKEWKSDVGT